MMFPQFKIKGYASIFGEPDLCDDIIMPGSFVGARAAYVEMRFEHTGRFRVGTWTRLEEDDKGLYVEGVVGKGKDCSPVGMVALLRRFQHKELGGLSIGFSVPPCCWTYRNQTPDSGRIITQIELTEVSIVRRPMAPKARYTIEEVELEQVW